MLDKVKRGVRVRAPKGVIYGPHKCGKSTLAATIPGSIIVDCENGLAYIGSDATPYLEDWPDIKKWLEFLSRQEHEYNCVVIDTMDWLMRRCEEQVSGAKKDLGLTLNKANGGYGNGKQALQNYLFLEILPLLDRMTERGIAVVLLSHLVRQEVTGIDGVAFEKNSPDLPPNLLMPVCEWSDFIFRLHRQGSNLTFVTEETQQDVAGNRYNLRGAMPGAWATIVDAIQNAKGQSNG